MPELDTLRGVAILAVVFYHGFSQCDTTGLPGIVRAFFAASRFGWLGVNLFFVLSGFLITGILLDSKGTPRYYKSFYVRRALRILPAYLLLLLLLLLLPRIGVVDGRISWSFVGLSLIYLSNVTNFFGVAMQYGPLWSLAVEEQFYLLWPAAVRNLSRRALAFCAVAVFLGCPFFAGHRVCIRTPGGSLVHVDGGRRAGERFTTSDLEPVSAHKPAVHEMVFCFLHYSVAFADSPGGAVWHSFAGPSNHSFGCIISLDAVQCAVYGNVGYCAFAGVEPLGADCTASSAAVFRRDQLRSVPYPHSCI